MSTLARTATLVHGYTMGDVEQLARKALGGYTRSLLAIDVDERHAIAWTAIVELLYSSYERPGRYDLLDAAMSAIRTAINDQFRHHGRNTTDPSQGRPSFELYWLEFGDAPPTATSNGKTRRTVWEDFTDAIAERMALPAVLGKLDADEYEAVVAYAAHGSSRTAARALSMSVTTFNTRLKSARQKVTRAWFEPETARPPAERATGDATTCTRGHQRAEHGFQDARGYWACRECQRKAQRDWARARRAEQAAVNVPDDDVPVPLTFAPATGLEEPCWCGLAYGHDWPHKAAGAAHPRVA